MSYPSAGRAWYTIATLSVIYLFSFMDRQILTLLVDPIKRDLHISDVQVSLLTGAAFAVLYSVMGIPIGWAADRCSRKALIGAGVLVWSGLTMACGAAGSFVQMFVARMGVGVGEAALTPTAFGMIPDLVAPAKRARAMSVFMMSAYLGAGAALIFGGLVVSVAARLGPMRLPLLGVLHTWQLVLVVVGSGTLLMLIPLSAITDPRSRAPGPAGRDGPSPISLQETLGYVWSHRGAYTPVMIGVTLLNLFDYGAAAWVPSYLMRNLGLSAGHAGYWLGAISMVFGISGVLISGMIADKWRAAGEPAANLRVMIRSLPLAWLGLIVFSHSTSVPWALTGYALMLTGQVACSPLAPAALQGITRAGMRSTVAALWLLIANLVGIGCGPTIVALWTDYYFKNDKQLGSALFYSGTLTFAVGGFLIWRFSAAYAHLAARREADDDEGFAPERRIETKSRGTKNRALR